MTKIEAAEELTRDWDWYACDQEGHIGHFTTAGLRGLPRSVKEDRDALERVGRYLSEDRKKWSEYSIRAGVAADAGGWKNSVARDRYLRSFIQAARRGMFSYNTEMRRGSDAKYYLVAKPDQPLRMSDLPPDIGAILSKTQVPISFAIEEYITETETLDW
jgi:hypothetical protein